MVTFGDKCSWCGCVICECKQEKITMTDDYLAKNYIRKKVLRKLVERWDKGSLTGNQFAIEVKTRLNKEAGER